MRLIFALLIAMLPLQGLAQSAEPILRQEFEEDTVVPGQTLILRLTVLVPSFLPTPPEFPTFETPNLMVRLPERSTNPTSETIDGETWSGLTRSYRITPLVAGKFDIPAQELSVTYKDTDGTSDVTTTLQTEPVTLNGVVPDAAAELSPFLAADRLTLDQKIDGTPEAMAPGDALVRTITVSIDNAPALMIPDVLDTQGDLAGLSVYPENPVLEESDNRGVITGKRTSSVTYVASSGGSYSLPEVTLQWFNLSSGAIETATAPAIEMTVDGPALSLPDKDRDWRLIGVIAVLAAGLLGLLIWVIRRYKPLLDDAVAEARARRLASESHAWKQVANALAAQDLTALNRAMRLWQEKLPDRPALDAASQKALEQITAPIYSASSAPASSEQWSGLASALTQFRKAAIAPAQASQPLHLQKLNPPL